MFSRSVLGSTIQKLSFVRHRSPKLGTAVLAACVLGAVVPAASQADSGPYAKVVDASGAVVQQFGAFYGAQPGTQIQLALNYARCGQTASPCLTPSGPPLYPKVVLEAGTYHLLSQFPLGIGGPRCVGIFAYSAVKLQAEGGPGSAVIENDITSGDPCGNPAAGELDAVVFSGEDPEHINTAGRSVTITNLRVNAGYHARFGVEVGALNGATGSTVAGITVTKPNSSGIIVGPNSLSAHGTANDPIMVYNNTVTGSRDDGITLGGTYLKATGNSISDTADHAIALFQPAGTANIEVSANTINDAIYGISLDGSGGQTGSTNRVFNNTIYDTCTGIQLFRQAWADVAGNTITTPKPDATCLTAGGLGTHQGYSTGIAIMDSNRNVVWSNQIRNYNRGLFLKDGNLSPDLLGTIWNYIGVVDSWGQPFPSGWPAAGNWIVSPVVGVLIRSDNYPNPPGNTGGNAIADNVVDNASWVPCFVETSQWVGGNNFGCVS